MDLVDKYISYVNPQMHISSDASAVNNIYDDDVINAKTIDQLFPSILEFIEGFPLVMHNAKFDILLFSIKINDTTLFPICKLFCMFQHIQYTFWSLINGEFTCKRFIFQ